MTSHPTHKPTIMAAIAPPILLTALVGLGIGLTIPLLALDMERRGVVSSLQGLNAAVSGLANILVVPFVPALALRVGVRPVIIASLVTVALCTLAFKLSSSLPLWFVLRFVSGAAFGTLFTLSEYWIASNAPDGQRGFVIGIYATALSASFALGPLLLLAVGGEGWTPYVTVAALFVLALAPLMMAALGPPPPREDRQRGGVFATIASMPAATLAAFATGAIETAGLAHLAIIGTRAGLSVEMAAVYVVALSAGNVLFQIPVGFLADRMDKRQLLRWLAVFGMAAIVLFGANVGRPSVAIAALFLAGGLTGALYTVGLALLGGSVTGAALATANAAFVVLYSTGLMLGPPLAGIGIDVMGLVGFTVVASAILAGYLAVSLRERT